MRRRHSSLDGRWGRSRAGWVRGRKRLEGRLARRGLAPEHADPRLIDDLRALVMPVPLVLAVATTRAAVQSCPGAASTAGTVSPSIALLLQRELAAMLLAKIKLAAGAAIAGAAAILIGITMAGPLFGRGQELLPLAGTAGSRKVVARSAPGGAPTGGVARNTQARPPEAQRMPVVARERVLSPFGKNVFRSIHGGVEFLLSRQLPDGSWADVEQDAKTGMTSLVVLALFAAGEKVGSPAIDKALEFLRRFGPEDLHSTYAISLQTMAARRCR